MDWVGIRSIPSAVAAMAGSVPARTAATASARSRRRTCILPERRPPWRKKFSWARAASVMRSVRRPSRPSSIRRDVLGRENLLHFVARLCDAVAVKMVRAAAPIFPCRVGLWRQGGLGRGADNSLRWQGSC
jgi:hypothetical protein